MSQLDLFAGHQHSVVISDIPDPAEIRARMETVLARLDSSEGAPWPQKKMRLWRVIWPQMMRWLPEADHAELQSRFDRLMGRFTEN